MVEHAGMLPLYEQIRAVLQREIETSMRPGDMLPPEPDLEKRFGVSRITVRRALDELVADGLITRQQGRGTFVREPHITHDLTELLSWTTAMRRHGYEPQTVECAIELADPEPNIASMLRLSPGEGVVRVFRVRGAEDEPICLMTNYLPQALVPGLPSRGLVGDSVYATLASYRLAPMHVADTVEARAATEWEAMKLSIRAGSPLLQVVRISYERSGNPLDVAIVSSRADRYRYTAHFQARDDNSGVVVRPHAGAGSAPAIERGSQ